MSRVLEALSLVTSTAWKWLRGTPHLSGLCTIAAVCVVLLMQWSGYHEQFDTNPRNGVEVLESKGWAPPTQAILVLRYLLPYLGIWLMAGGVVLHVALLRAWPSSRRMVRPVWIGSLFLAAWAVASDLSDHLEFLEISISGEPASTLSYGIKLGMIALACLIPAAGLHWYSRALLLNRYTMRSFLGPAAFCFAAFCSLWILMDLLDSLKDFQEQRTPLGTMFLFYLSLVPFIFVSVAPAAILLGVLYSLTKMSRANELVSMLSAGRSVVQILVPIFVCALLASMLSMAANYHWAPRAEGNRKAIMRALIEGEAGTIMAESLLYRNPETRRTWYAGSFPFNLRDEKIRNIEVRQEDENGQIQRAWIARSAAWWPLVNQWRFYQGQEIIYRDGKPYSMIDFTGRDPLMPSKLDVEGISETPWSIVSSSLVPDNMGVPDLLAYLQAHSAADPRSLAPFRTQLHHRFAFPWQSLVLALVAAPLGIAYSRRGALGGIAASIFIFFGMIFVNDVFVSLGKGSHIPAWITVWIPNLGFGLLGGVMLYLRSQNKELPKISFKIPQVRRPKNQMTAPAGAV